MQKRIGAEVISSAPSADGATLVVKSETKQCSTCLEALPISEFYSKGNRTDSSCKRCVRQKKRSTYLEQKDKYNLDHVRRAVDILLDWELEKLKEYNRNLKEAIEQCQNKEPQ